MEVLYKHAIEGFTGSKGVMPPRGGAGNLGDDEIKATVDYMLSVGS
jgi:cytochrome c5